MWLQQELSRKSLSPNCRGRRKQRESNSDFTVFIINKRRWRSSAVITWRLMFRICSVPWCHFLFNSSPVLMRQSSSWLLKHLVVMVLAVQIQWPSNYKCQDTVRDHHDALQSPLLTRALALRPSKLTELVKLNWLLIRAGKMQKKSKRKSLMRRQWWPEGTQRWGDQRAGLVYCTDNKIRKGKQQKNSITTICVIIYVCF